LEQETASRGILLADELVVILKPGRGYSSGKGIEHSQGEYRRVLELGEVQERAGGSLLSDELARILEV
jgi:hypothetical protein